MGHWQVLPITAATANRGGQMRHDRNSLYQAARNAKKRAEMHQAGAAIGAVYQQKPQLERPQ
jgi:hypothetical protein